MVEDVVEGGGKGEGGMRDEEEEREEGLGGETWRRECKAPVTDGFSTVTVHPRMGGTRSGAQRQVT